MLEGYLQARSSHGDVFHGVRPFLTGSRILTSYEPPVPASAGSYASTK
jgi:hypothetical protein